MDVLFFRLAIACWLASAIFPIDGTWFAGVGLFVVSVMGSVVMLTNLTPDHVDSFLEVLGLLNLLMPWYNLLFLLGLARFPARSRLLSCWGLLLCGAALHAVFFAVAAFVGSDEGSLTVTATGIRCVFTLWSGALLFLALAFLVRCYRLHRCFHEG